MGINPTVVETDTKNMAVVDVFSRLMKERIIYFYDEVDAESSAVIISQLLFLERKGKDKPIHLYINSPGGECLSGLAIYDTIKRLKCPIYTYACGMAASMAASIFAAGDKGHRYILPHSRIMIHQPSGASNYCKASDFEIKYNELEKMKKELAECLANDTGKTVDEILADFDRDYWMDGKEAVAYGIADEVI